MAKAKYGIKDKNTLVLLEDAKKDDIIDLSEKIGIDKDNLISIINDTANKHLDSEYKKKYEELLKKDIDTAVSNEKIKNEAKIKELEALIKSNKEKNDLEIQKIKSDAKIEIEGLKSTINGEKDRTSVAISNAVQTYIEKLNKSESEHTKELSEKNIEITNLKNDVKNVASEIEIQKQKEIQELEAKIKMQEIDIEKWKAYRYGDSTKDLGESLEKYCSDCFEEVRAIAFPNSVFIKDNDDKSGSKGDYIFKEDLDGIELTSIMFDMKTEKDDTEKKHKNEEFFKKLDKDRNEKKCEYAVLVSTLESDSKLYNNGIVDVSHKYPKMFVIRPQFFISFIGLIRNMALRNHEDKLKLVKYESEHIDLTNFENQVKDISVKIMGDYNFAQKKYDEVDKMCNDIITKVNAFRDAFRVAYTHVGTAVNRLEKLSLETLSKKNPTIKAKLDELKKD